MVAWVDTFGTAGGRLPNTLGVIATLGPELEPGAIIASTPAEAAFIAGVLHGDRGRISWFSQGSAIDQAQPDGDRSKGASKSEYWKSRKPALSERAVPAGCRRLEVSPPETGILLSDFTLFGPVLGPVEMRRSRARSQGARTCQTRTSARQQWRRMW